MNIRFYILTILIVFSATFSIAQEQTNDTLLIDEINVTKSYDPKLKEAFKITSNPVLVDTVPKTVPMKYKTITKNLDNNITTEPIKAAKIKGGEPLKKLQRGYAKIGIGTNTTPLVDVYFNSKQSKSHSLGVFYKHLSSIGEIENYPTASFSDNSVGFIGKKFYSKNTLTGDVTFNRNVNYYYGVDQNAYQTLLTNNGVYSDEKQIYSKLGTSLNYAKTKKLLGKSFYDFVLDFYNFSDNSSANENKLGVNAQFIKPLNKESLQIDFATDYYNSTIPGLIYDNTILTLNPTLNSKKENLNFKIGFIANTNLDSSSSISIAPDAELNYFFLDKIYKVTLGVNGGLQKNSFESLATENPFIELVNVSLKNSQTIYNAYFNLKGTLSKNTTFNIGASHKQVEDMALFFNINNITLLENKMNILYDDVSQTTINGEIAYNKNKNLNLVAKGSYYLFNTNSESEAWHKPNFTATLTTNYKYKNLVFSADAFIVGEKPALDYITSNTGTITTNTQLNSILDFNLGFEYKYTKKLSAFLDFYNLANQQQFTWNNYPSQGLNVLGGVKFSF